MLTKIAITAVRLLVAAGIYVAVASFLLHQATGWESLGLLGAAIGFAMVGLAAWGFSVFIGHMFMPEGWRRALAHPVIVTGLFVLIGFFGITAGWGTPPERLMNDMRPFIALVAGASLADAMIGWAIGCLLLKPSDRAA
jgi:hypothetical protein